MTAESEPVKYGVVYNTFAKNENPAYSSVRYIWYCKDLGQYYITHTSPASLIDPFQDNKLSELDKTSTLDKLYDPVALSIYNRLACKAEYSGSTWKFTLK